MPIFTDSKLAMVDPLRKEFETQGMWQLIISTKIIGDLELLKLFRDRFENLSGNNLEMSYLEGASVRGFFKKDNLVAGYVVNKVAPFRLLLWIPKNVRTEFIESNVPGGMEACCELTCLWKDRSRVSYWEMNWIYIVAVLDGLISGKRNILGGTFVKAVGKGQNRILKNIVYSGPSEFKNGKHCDVYFATRLGSLWGLLREFVTELAKSVRSGLRKKSRQRVP